MGQLELPIGSLCANRFVIERAAGRGATLRQIKLRADNTDDAFFRRSYLTRNRRCVRALAPAQAWAVDFALA